MLIILYYSLALLEYLLLHYWTKYVSIELIFSTDLRHYLHLLLCKSILMNVEQRELSMDWDFVQLGLYAYLELCKPTVRNYITTSSDSVFYLQIQFLTKCTVYHFFVWTFCWRWIRDDVHIEMNLIRWDLNYFKVEDPRFEKRVLYQLRYSFISIIKLEWNIF